MRFWIAVAALIACPSVGLAQPVFAGHEIFPPAEFAARRARIMETIGSGVAIIQGTTERPGEQAFRQNNQFFYLCGVVEPRAILVIDGRTKQSTVFMQPRNERREQRMLGPGLYPGPEAAAATGLDAVRAREEFAAALSAVAADGRPIYTPFRPDVLGEASSSDPAASWRASKADPWDGRGSREEAFLAKLKAAAPQSELKDLDPLIEDERLGVRLEDMLVVTDTGVENLSAFVPIDVPAIEALMAQKGLSEYRIK